MNQEIAEKESLELDEFVDDEIYYQSFFGEKEAGYYSKRFKRVEDGEVALFNVYAFFFSFLWLAYRKMYFEILILFLVLVFTGIIWYWILGIDNVAFDKITNLLWSLAIGGFANYFYMKKARRTVEKAKETYNGLSNRIEYLKKVGGTSLLSLFLCFFILLGLSLLTLFLEDYNNSYYY